MILLSGNEKYVGLFTIIFPKKFSDSTFLNIICNIPKFEKKKIINKLLFIGVKENFIMRLSNIFFIMG